MDDLDKTIAEQMKNPDFQKPWGTLDSKFEAIEVKFDVSYLERGVEKEIPDWKGKTVESAKVVHLGSDGRLTITFTDGTTQKYDFNELAFWESTLVTE